MFHNNGVSKENTVLRELLDILMIGCIEWDFLGNVNSMGILAPTVNPHEILSEMQLLGPDSLCFYTFKKGPCLKKSLV